MVELLKITDGVAYVAENVPTTGSPNSNFDNYDADLGIDDLADPNNIDNSDGSNITGINNVVDGDLATVIGNNNTVEDGVSNAVIIGANNVTITQDNEMYIGETRYIDGKIVIETLTIPEAEARIAGATLTPGTSYKVGGYTLKASSVNDFEGEGQVTRRVVLESLGGGNNWNTSQVGTISDGNRYLTGNATNPNELSLRTGGVFVPIATSDNAYYKDITNTVGIKVDPTAAAGELINLVWEKDRLNNTGTLEVSRPIAICTVAIMQCLDSPTVFNNTFNVVTDTGLSTFTITDAGFENNEYYTIIKNNINTSIRGNNRYNSFIQDNVNCIIMNHNSSLISGNTGCGIRSNSRSNIIDNVGTPNIDSNNLLAGGAPGIMTIARNKVSISITLNEAFTASAVNITDNIAEKIEDNEMVVGLGNLNIIGNTAKEIKNNKDYTGASTFLIKNNIVEGNISGNERTAVNSGPLEITDNTAAFINANTSDDSGSFTISQNKVSGVISANTNNGGAFLISKNRMPGGIEYNDNSAGPGEIKLNINNGGVYRNTLQSSVNIERNNNNGDIGNEFGGGTNRSTTVTTTVSNL